MLIRLFADLQQQHSCQLQGVFTNVNVAVEGRMRYAPTIFTQRWYRGLRKERKGVLSEKERVNM